MASSPLSAFIPRQAAQTRDLAKDLTNRPAPKAQGIPETYVQLCRMPMSPKELEVLGIDADVVRSSQYSREWVMTTAFPKSPAQAKAFLRNPKWCTTLLDWMSQRYIDGTEREKQQLERYFGWVAPTADTGFQGGFVALESYNKPNPDPYDLRMYIRRETYAVMQLNSIRQISATSKRMPDGKAAFAITFSTSAAAPVTTLVKETLTYKERTTSDNRSSSPDYTLHLTYCSISEANAALELLATITRFYGSKPALVYAK